MQARRIARCMLAIRSCLHLNDALTCQCCRPAPSRTPLLTGVPVTCSGTGKVPQQSIKVQNTCQCRSCFGTCPCTAGVRSGTCVVDDLVTQKVVRQLLLLHTLCVEHDQAAEVVGQLARRLTHDQIQKLQVCICHIPNILPFWVSCGFVCMCCTMQALWRVAV